METKKKTGSKTVNKSASTKKTTTKKTTTPKEVKKVTPVAKEEIKEVIVQNNNDNCSYNKYIKGILVGVIVLIINSVLVDALLFDIKTKLDENRNQTSRIHNVIFGEEKQDVDYDVSSYTKTTADDFVELSKKNSKSIVYFGRKSCDFCVQFVPTLTAVQKELDLDVYYVDIETIDSTGVSKIKAVDEFFKTNYGVTPAVVIVGNNEVIDNSLGAVDASTLKEFLSKNGIK